MIYDGLDAIGLYRGLTRGLDVLIDWLGKNDPADLPLGITEIDGKRVYANVMNTSTKHEKDARFEMHRKYMDVQIDFDEATDKGHCHAAEGNDDLLEGCLAGGRFVVFMIGEPHMPNLVTPGAEPGAIKKICFKVAGDQFWDEV